MKTIRFKRQPSFNSEGELVFFSTDRLDITFLNKALNAPRKKPITLGQALTLKLEYVDQLCDQNKYKEAGEFQCHGDLVKYISDLGYHIEINETDYELI